jgi:hypothetical protein
MTTSIPNSDKSPDGSGTSSTDSLTAYIGQFALGYDAPDDALETTGELLVLHASDGVTVRELGSVVPLATVETERVTVQREGEPFLRAEADGELLTIRREGAITTRELLAPRARTLDHEQAAALLRANATSTVSAVESLAAAVEDDAASRSAVESASAETDELAHLVGDVGAAFVDCE